MEQQITMRQCAPCLIGVVREQLAMPGQHALPDLLGGQHADNLTRGLQKHVPRSGKHASIGRRAGKRQRGPALSTFRCRPYRLALGWGRQILPAIQRRPV